MLFDQFHVYIAEWPGWDWALVYFSDLFPKTVVYCLGLNHLRETQGRVQEFMPNLMGSISWACSYLQSSWHSFDSKNSFTLFPSPLAKKLGLWIPCSAAYFPWMWMLSGLRGQWDFPHSRGQSSPGQERRASPAAAMSATWDSWGLGYENEKKKRKKFPYSLLIHGVLFLAPWNRSRGLLLELFLSILVKF